MHSVCRLFKQKECQLQAAVAAATAAMAEDTLAGLCGAAHRCYSGAAPTCHCFMPCLLVLQRAMSNAAKRQAKVAPRVSGGWLAGWQHTHCGTWTETAVTFSSLHVVHGWAART